MSSADATPDDAPDDAPQKPKRWLVPVVALLIGSVGAAAFTQSDTLRQTVGLAAADSTAAPEPEPVEFGQFTEMDGIVVNPRGTDGRRYLMVRLGVEAKKAETLSRLDALRPAAVDAVIEMMAQQPVEALTDVSQRDSLKEAIRSEFNRLLGKDGPVTRIYFTQYVLQ